MDKLILLVADYANVDQSGKLNVLGAFGRIYASAFPAKHTSMHLVVKLGAELGEYGQTKTLVVKFRDEDGKDLARLPPIEFKVPSPSKGQTPEINFIFQLTDLLLPSQGKYEFGIFVDDIEIGVLPIDVEKFTPHQQG